MSKVLPSIFVLVLLSFAAPLTTWSQASPPATSVQGVPRTNTSSPSMKHALTAWLESLRKIQPSGDVDQDFAALMKVYHQGALSLAQLQLSRGKSSDLKAVANAVLAVRQREIAYLDKWIASGAHAPRPGSRLFDGNPGTSMATRIARLEGTLLSADTDNDFGTLLKALNVELIDMVKGELLQGLSAELKSTARQIIAVQTKEIAQVDRWLSRQKSRRSD
jgi:uncharacterized protein (DUF305 family)